MSSSTPSISTPASEGLLHRSWLVLCAVCALLTQDVPTAMADRDHHNDCVQLCDLDCNDITYCDVDYRENTCQCVLEPWFITVVVLVPLLCIGVCVVFAIIRCCCCCAKKAVEAR